MYPDPKPPHAGIPSDEVTRQQEEWGDGPTLEFNPFNPVVFFIAAIGLFAAWLIYTAIQGAAWAVTYFGAGPGQLPY